MAGTDNDESIETPNHTASAQQSPQSDPGEAKDQMRVHEKWLIGTNIILALGTIFGLVFTGVQLRYTSKALEQSRSANEIANQSLQQNKSAFQAEQRPYVKINTVSFKNGTPPKVGQHLLVNIKFQNIGKSIANSYAVTRHVLSGPEALTLIPSVFRAERDLVASEQPERTLGPSEERLTTAVLIKAADHYPPGLERASFYLPWDGSKPVFVFGTISYRDSFGQRYVSDFIYEHLHDDVWLVRSDRY